ncbi:MAG: pyruvate kinase [Verrucomicrobiales bacterium]|jgi:pyruvate kinase
MLRKTKIIATLGPATESAKAIEQLIAVGVNIFRLNMSHAKHKWTRDVVARVRKASEKTGTTVAVLMDLQGPSIRTGVLEKPIALKPGDQLEVRSEDTEAELKASTTSNYSGLSLDVSKGDTMLVDNGVLHLKILETREDRVICEVLTEGELTSRRHINLPGVRVNLPGLTGKDKKDLALAAELDTDFVAMSFVRDAEHVQLLRNTMKELDFDSRIVAKIEDQEAVKHIDEIILASDAVMVARGDLGIEVHVEELPIIQRTILQRSAVLGRKVIVATHMLESMIENPVPTRAEVTDIANAVYEQADAIMLSGETSVGSYPAKCVEMFDRIARRMEREPGAKFCANAELKTDKQKTVNSAVVLANSLEDAAILVFTARGVMANYVAHLRPERTPIFAFTPDPKICRALVMNRAVQPFLLDFHDDPNVMIDSATQQLLAAGLIKENSSIVILSDVLAGKFVVDSILLKKV